MIAEAVDTAFALGWALAAWFVLTAAFATAALYTVIAAGWWIARGVWRAVRALLPRRTPTACVSRPFRRPAALASTETLPAPPEAAPALPARATPTWARTDKEAA